MCYAIFNIVHYFAAANVFNIIAAYILEIRETIVALVIENIMLLDNMDHGLLVLKNQATGKEGEREEADELQFINQSALSLLKQHSV